MEIDRKIRLFFVSYGRLLLECIGIIVLIIFIIQSLNKYVAQQNKENKLTEEEVILQQQKKEEEKKEAKETKEDKDYIKKFIDYCNEGNKKEAYKMLSQQCKEDKYPTIESFEKNYVSKIFINKKDYEITKEGNIYKVFFLEDILQAGTIENRQKIEDYYSIYEDIVGEKSINIDVYNNI